MNQFILAFIIVEIVVLMFHNILANMRQKKDHEFYAERDKRLATEQECHRMSIENATKNFLSIVHRIDKCEERLGV